MDLAQHVSCPTEPNQRVVWLLLLAEKNERRHLRSVSRGTIYSSPASPMLDLDQLREKARTNLQAPASRRCYARRPLWCWAPLVSTTLCADAADENRGMRPSTSVG